jgi:hypothetical protein
VVGVLCGEDAAYDSRCHRRKCRYESGTRLLDFGPRREGERGWEPKGKSSPLAPHWCKVDPLAAPSFQLHGQRGLS